MTKSRFIFTRIIGDSGPEGYIVRSRRTGFIIGNVWRRWDPYSQGLKRGWAAQYKPYTVYRTRLEAAKAL